MGRQRTQKKMLHNKLEGTNNVPLGTATAEKPQEEKSKREQRGEAPPVTAGVSHKLFLIRPARLDGVRRHIGTVSRPIRSVL